MLTEVIKPRPDLVLLGTIHGGTTEAPVRAILGHDFMNTLLVSIEIIVGTETVNFKALGDVAFERFLMPKRVFPGSLLPTEEIHVVVPISTYLCSD